MGSATAKFKLNTFTLTGLLSLVFAVLAGSTIVWAQLPPVIDLKFGEEDVLIYGEAGDQLTNSRLLAMGDLNNDGKVDLVLGTYFADGPSNSRTDCGEAYIYFGKENLAGTKDILGIDGDAPDVTIYGADIGDQMTQAGGIVGDLNNDGMDDLVLSSVFGQGPENLRGHLTGEIVVIFGRENGATWPPIIDLANDEQDVIIYGPEMTSDLAGERALLIADLNGDGLNDLVTGSNRSDDNAGRAYIIYGEAPWPSVIDLNTSPTETVSDHHADVTIYGIRSGGVLGDRLTNDGSMIAADLNGDGYQDLVLAAHYARTLEQTHRNYGDGEVYIIYGGPSIPAEIRLANAPGISTIRSGIYSARLGRERTLQAGDLNGDGYDDLVMGAYREDNNVGFAFVVFGGPALASRSLIRLHDDYAEYDVKIRGIGPVTLYGLMDIGNINGDEYADLVLGTQHGKISVIYGGPSLPSLIRLNLNEEDIVIANCPVPIERALQLGDINGDGLDDIVAGGGKYNGPDSDPRLQSGGAFLIYGTASLPPAIDLAIDHPDVMVHGATAGDQLTFSARMVGAFEIGDLTGDGFDDLMFGSYLAGGPSESRPSAGEAYVIFGPTNVVEAEFPVVSPPGDAPPQEFGVTRTTVDYNSGDASGESSLTTVTLVRDNAETGLADLSKAANVTWGIESDRTDFEANVTFGYTDAEIDGLDESQLVLYTSPDINGDYTEVPSVLDVNRNEITGLGLTHFSFFIIVDKTDSDFDGIPDAFDTATLSNLADLVMLTESGKSTTLDRRTRKLTSISTVTITNSSSQTIAAPMNLVVTGVPAGITMPEASGTTTAGDFYYELGGPSLGPDESTIITIKFVYASTVRVTYGLEFWGLVQLEN